MLEYVPRDRFVEALAGLRARLVPGGRFILFITRRNVLMDPLIGRWWDSNLYTRDEIEAAFQQAGFAETTFHKFPGMFAYLNLWGYVVEGR